MSIFRKNWGGDRFRRRSMFQIEIKKNMIVVKVFFLIMNQTEIIQIIFNIIK